MGELWEVWVGTWEDGKLQRDERRERERIGEVRGSQERWGLGNTIPQF